MVQRKVHKIDAKNQILGRLASQIALILRGKNKVEYQPNVDGGDIVEVINVAKIKLSGKKIEQKKYYSYSGYPGGLKTTKISDVMDKNPALVLKRAVTQMLPENKLRKNMIKRLIIK